MTYRSLPAVPPTWSSSRGFWAMFVAAVASMLLLGMMARNIIHHQPVYDELVHVLAAQGLLRTGQPAIADGIYDRALLFTRLVAKSITWQGNTLLTARLPALIAGLLLVGLLSAWVTRNAGLMAGFFAGFALVLYPGSAEVAVLCRFYSLHALAIAVALIALYGAMNPGQSLMIRGLLVSLTVAAGALAWQLQATSIIALGSGFIGLSAAFAPDYWGGLRTSILKRPVICAVGALSLLVVGLFAMQRFGLFEQLRAVPLWDRENENRVGFYVNAMSREIPFFWPLLPISTVAAVLLNRRLGVFCVVMVASGLLVHSVAAQKAMRYVYYLLPFMAALWGCALAAGVSKLSKIFRLIISRNRRFAAGHHAAMRLSLAAALLTTGFTLAITQEGQHAIRILVSNRLGLSMLSFAGEADWSKALPPLKLLVARSDLVIASNSMKALYYLGNYDYELNANGVDESESRAEFGLDSRTGRRAISTPASMEAIINRSGRKVVIVESEKLGKDVGVPAGVVSLLQERCGTVLVPAQAGIAVWDCGKP